MEVTIFLLIGAVFSLEADCMTPWKNKHYLKDDHGEASEYHLAEYHGKSTNEGVYDEHQHTSPYQGPIAVPVVLANGHLADTHEVAEAKSHHLGAVVEAKTAKHYNGHQERYEGAYGYSSSHKGYGIPVVLPNGHIADTLEVAAAKASHLLTVDKIKSKKYYEEDGHDKSGLIHGYEVPVVHPNRHTADTYEVAAGGWTT